MGFLLYTSSDTSENLIASWVSAAWMILQMSRHGVVAGTYQGGNMALGRPVVAPSTTTGVLPHFLNCPSSIALRANRRIEHLVLAKPEQRTLHIECDVAKSLGGFGADAYL